MKKTQIEKAIDQLQSEIAEREKTIALLKQYSVPKRKPRALKAVGDGKPA